MQNDFVHISMKIKGLMTSTVANGFPRYQTILSTMKANYEDFKLNLLKEIQTVCII